MNRLRFCVILGCLSLPCSLTAAADDKPAASPSRADWYRQSIVNLHCDNHSGLLGKGLPADELAAMFATLPVTMIQVSAQSNGYATYATQVGLNNPAAEGCDTLAAFKDIARRQGKRLCIYMSVDRRPLDLKAHPQWAAINAAGQQEIAGEPIVCQRPHRDRTGYLYERFVPQIQEIIRRYDPDGFWFDGDYILTRPCWCDRCLKEWKADTGLDAPRKPDDPQWERWIEWHRAGYRAYLHAVADAIHQSSPKALYTSNWSWAWTPEPAPDFADTLSGDAWNIGQVHSVVQRWGAQKTPWDIMSYCTPEARSLAGAGAQHRYSLQRTLQEGALTMAAGGVWFVWGVNGVQIPSYGIDVIRFCAQFARDRQAALGPSLSLSQVAVVDSETSWRNGGESGIGGRVHRIARSLAEAHYLTDIVNEQTLREASDRYAVVIVPEHRSVAPETLATLRTMVERGGLLLLAGAALRGQGEEPADVAELLGLKRTAPAGIRPARLTLNQQKYHLVDAWEVTPGQAKVVAADADGRPILCVHPVGKGTVGYLASSELRYPDGELMAGVLRALGRGPSYQVSGGGRDAAVLCSLRGKPGQVVLHVSDLSARVNGVPVDVDTPDYTDFNPPLNNLKITLPLPSAPSRVRAVPAGTLVATDYHPGRLDVSIQTMQTHAAVILETATAAPLASLPADAPSAARAFHPVDDRVGPLLADDFEAERPGQAPARGWAAENRDGASIAVTSETASHGRQSLKFADTAGSSFWPFLHRSITPMHQGAARLSFDVRVEPGAECLVEARYEGKGAGPSVRIDGEGKLHASGKSLTAVAPSVWHHLAIEFILDGDRPGYTLTVTSPGKPPQTFADLPYASPWFFLCNSLYFIGSGQKPGNFFLDNVLFERLPSPSP
jgi:hypothetical protein